MTLLTNGDFEARDAYDRPATWRQTLTGEEFGEISVPLGWTAFWDHDKGRPEMAVISAVAPYLDPPRVAEGQQALKWFTFYRDHDAGVLQQVSVPSGATLRLSALAHAWYSQGDDAHLSQYKDANGVLQTILDGEEGMDLSIGIDPAGSTDPWSGNVSWHTANIYDQPGEWFMDIAGAASTVTVFLRSTTLYPFKHCDAYWDNVRLEVVEPSDPEPTECRGLPREDYVRVYNVIPQDATPERAAEIAAIAWARSKQTVGGSYDDAGIGDLADKTAFLWDIAEADRDEYRAWFEAWYPGTVVRFDGDDGGTEPPPDPGIEPQYPEPGILIGLHSQQPKTGWLDFYRAVKPSVFKAVDQLGMCVECKDASPDTLVVFRRHVQDDADWIHRADLRASARAFLDIYSASINTHAANTGMSVAQVLEHLDVLESVNEVIGNYDPDLEPSVAFEIEFMDAIHERYGNQVRAGVLTIPVGNPHESEVVKLLPAVRHAYEGGHYIAYHPYWSANELTSFLIPHWPWLAGRWMEWDKVFRANGVYPLYYGGEMGMVYALDGWSMHSGLGWKSCGPFSKYIVDLIQFQGACMLWNDAHGNRFRGGTIFCYGSYGWDDFEFEPGDLAELGVALL